MYIQTQKITIVMSKCVFFKMKLRKIGRACCAKCRIFNYDGQKKRYKVKECKSKAKIVMNTVILFKSKPHFIKNPSCRGIFFL